jgi:HemY protein
MKRAWLSLLFLILKLALMGILVAVAYYLPGEGNTQLRFVDYIIDIKTGALTAGCVAVIILTFYIFKSLAWVKQLPVKLKQQLQERRLRRAKECLLESYIAMSSGELEVALDMAMKSKGLDKAGVFHDIFEAQALFMAGEFDQAEVKFDQLRQCKKTKFLGLRGLISMRKKQNRHEETRLLLIEALKDRPQSVWVLKELLDYNLKQLEFDKANTVIEQLRITGHLDKQKSHRYQALVAWLRALQAKRSGDQSAFETYAQQSLKLDPQLTAATLELAQYYHAHGQSSKCIKILGRGYENLPHLDYLGVFQAVLGQETTLDQYRLVENIIGKKSDSRASHIILATLAIAAKLWGQARLHINILNERPTQLVYSLLADLERAEHPNHSQAISDYLKLAVQGIPEGEWVCHNCHTAQLSWNVFCPSCQAFDQIKWETPVLPTSSVVLIK